MESVFSYTPPTARNGNFLTAIIGTFYLAFNKRRYMDTSRLEKKVIDHPAESDLCPQGGEQMVQKGYREVSRLCMIPRKYYVQVDRYPVYECPKCSDDQGNSITSVEKPEPALIEGSLVNEEVVANLAFTTYMMGTTLYRLEKTMAEYGLYISRETMANWLDGCYDLYIYDLNQLIQKDFSKQKYVMLDESTHNIVKNKKKRSTCYELVGMSGRNEPKQIALYKFSRDRSYSIVSSMLGVHFQGVIQSDGY